MEGPMLVLARFEGGPAHGANVMIEPNLPKVKWMDAEYIAVGIMDGKLVYAIPAPEAEDVEATVSD